ncbi:uncharacterized protein MICPUCDRAFT_47213 [Micromonas pusilla CCMP1545]|jgi:hypothetical protein|uniref:Predicted protein n=2 Tax=Micromonas pusilla TaxID=38833 RepID=C1MSQ9_MICPC|nr:uncharacterized protein MICPUCDRAFT_47213 [Micromonas pusilla CCMP1545]EEH57175.1 predicted protein [Micromonas pusilla CCMP1545]|eukprot:XP_003058720.1 predicted protein [Micromonas pusilla CCMP1545]
MADVQLVNADALARFLAGPPRAPDVAPARDAAAAVQRRRWGVAPAIEKDDTCADAAPAAPPSWWQNTSWFANAAADVSPVLADPAGADGGAVASTIRGAAAVGGAICQNRFTGVGQRDPIRPVAPQSVRLNGLSAVEDPGEVHGGHNASTRVHGGGAYVPVGGAMAHSRLSLQPRDLRAKGPRCADSFEAARAVSRGDTADGEKRDTACAVANNRAKPRYAFDFERGVWEVQGAPGAAVLPERERAAAAAAAVPRVDDGSSDEEKTTMTPEELALVETTRGLRLNRFGANHEASLAAAAAKRRAARNIESATLRGSASHKRAASAVPLPSDRRGSDSKNSIARTDEARDSGVDTWTPAWQMLRLENGDVVFFGAPDASPASVRAWLSGKTPWPEVRVMELSKRARSAQGVPRGAPGPIASSALVNAAKEELARIAEEDDAADADAAATGEKKTVNLPPGSTASPQQANIIEQLVHATGAGKREGDDVASEAPATTTTTPTTRAEKEMEALKDALRASIRERRALTTRTRALEDALAAAGLPIPPP